MGKPGPLHSPGAKKRLCSFQCLSSSIEISDQSTRKAQHCRDVQKWSIKSVIFLQNLGKNVKQGERNLRGGRKKISLFGPKTRMKVCLGTHRNGPSLSRFVRLTAEQSPHVRNRMKERAFFIRWAAKSSVSVQRANMYMWWDVSRDVVGIKRFDPVTDR